MAKKNFILCVDLGGTKISAGVCTVNGKIVGEKIKVPTMAERPAKEIIDRITGAMGEAVKKAKINKEEILGIGIGSPGPLDMEKGIILTPPNLPTLQNFNIKKSLEKATGLPVYVNNDGNVFVLGESWFGAGAGENIVYGITLGTGFGSGLVINKKIFNGATGTAAEIWCFPYKGGIIEDFASGRGIKRIYKEKTGNDTEPIEIAELAKKGDEMAKAVWIEYGKHIGTALAYVVDVIDPNVIVVGGSISAQYELFGESMERTLRSLICPRPRAHIKIKKAKLKDASLLGAACLVLQVNSR